MMWGYVASGMNNLCELISRSLTVTFFWQLKLNLCVAFWLWNLMSWDRRVHETGKWGPKGLLQPLPGLLGKRAAGYRNDDDFLLPFHNFHQFGEDIFVAFKKFPSDANQQIYISCVGIPFSWETTGWSCGVRGYTPFSWNELSICESSTKMHCYIQCVFQMYVETTNFVFLLGSCQRIGRIQLDMLSFILVIGWLVGGEM